jgi:hypothetical protein
MAKVLEAGFDRIGGPCSGSELKRIYHQRQREITKMMTKTSARFI